METFSRRFSSRETLFFFPTPSSFLDLTRNIVAVPSLGVYHDRESSLVSSSGKSLTPFLRRKESWTISSGIEELADKLLVEICISFHQLSVRSRMPGAEIAAGINLTIDKREKALSVRRARGKMAARQPAVRIRRLAAKWNYPSGSARSDLLG